MTTTGWYKASDGNWYHGQDPRPYSAPPQPDGNGGWTAPTPITPPGAAAWPGTHAAGGPTPRLPRYRRRSWQIGGAAAGVLLVMGALGGSHSPSTTTATDNSSPEEATTQPAASATPAPTTKPAPPPSATDTLSAAVRKKLGKSNRKVTRVTVSDITPGEPFVITIAFNENITEGFIKDGARIDTVDALQTVHRVAGAWQFPELTIKGTYGLEDQYGNATETRVLLATYTKATINRINYDAIDFKRIFDLAEPLTYLHPAFRY